MLRKLLIVVVLLMAVIPAISQTLVTGNLSDSTENIILKNTSVALMRASDSVLVSFTRSNAQGDFKLSLPDKGTYILLISHPDYADFVDILTEGHDYGNVFMQSKLVVLQNVVITGSPIRMKGDTIIYTADSFKLAEGATTEDLLRRLPGFAVNAQGEITAQGKRVTRVLVDGDEFFGDDPTLATRNIVKEAVREVEVFDKLSEQSEFTGVDDGNAERTINLKLKDEFKKGYFGKLDLGNGEGDGYRYQNQGMINAFKDKRKLSAFAIGSNTNRNSLDWNAESQFGGGMGQQVIMEGGAMIVSGSSDEFGGFGNFGGEGIPQTLSIGGSYANKWNESRSNVSSAYRYQQLATDAISNSTTQYLLPDTQFVNNNSNNNHTERWRHRMNARSEIFIDSAQSLVVNLNASIGQVTSLVENIRESYSYKDEILNRNLINGITTNKSDQKNSNTSLLYRVKFKKAGRTLSTNFSHNYAESDALGLLVTESNSYDREVLVNTLLTDQQKDNYTLSNVVGFRSTYTEPINKNSLVELSVGYDMNNTRQKRLSYDRDNGAYSKLNEEFSNDFKFDNQTIRSGLVYLYNNDKIRISGGGDVGFTKWKQMDMFNNTRRNHDFTNFFPRSRFTYKIARNSSLSFNYRGNTQAPTADQLQPMRNNLDQLNIYVGNPDLKQAFNHNFSLDYNFFKMLNNSGLFSSLSYSFVQHAFATNRRIDKEGRNVTQTVNVDGQYSVSLWADYSLKLKKPDLNINLGYQQRIDRFISFINGQENRTTNINYSFSPRISKWSNEKYQFSINPDISYVVSNSTLNDAVNYFSSNSTMEGTYNFKQGFRFTTIARYTWRQKTPQFPDFNHIVNWNIGLDKKISKKEDMRLGVAVNDVLNQNMGLRRNVNPTSITESTYNTLRRHWLVTFVWNFRNKGGTPPSSEQ